MRDMAQKHSSQSIRCCCAAAAAAEPLLLLPIQACPHFRSAAGAMTWLSLRRQERQWQQG